MNENARKWVEALRSGEFEQTTGTLRHGNGFCCLGVACELHRRENGERWRRNRAEEWTYAGGNEVLGDVVRDWLGLASGDGYSFNRPPLTRINDDGATFTEIADLIESEPEGLFRGE